jgi:hypothetical protein
VTARQGEKVTLNDISVECRDKTNNINTFLIKYGNEVAAQFRISDECLQEVADSIMYLTEYPAKTRRFKDSEVEVNPSFCIKDLRAGMKHINLCAKVLEMSAPKQVNTKFGNTMTLAKALIDDDSGKIHLCLWDDQILAISVNDIIAIEDAKVTRYKDILQLNVGKNGKITKKDTSSAITPSPCELHAE